MLDPVTSCFKEVFQARLPGLGSHGADRDDFLAMCTAGILGALVNTESLPRDHWVWRPGYADTHVNLARLRDYLTHSLRATPHDTASLWARIALDIVEETGWGRESLLALHHLNPLQPSWPIYAAVFSQQPWAPAHAIGLRAFLEQTGLSAAAGPTISAILDRLDPYIDRHGDPEFTREWAGASLLVLLENPAA